MQRKQQELNKNSNSIHLEYERPNSNHRLYAAIVDFFVGICIILLLVYATSSIIKTTPFFEKHNSVITDYKLSSKLYEYDAKDELTVVTNLLLIEDDNSASQLVNKCVRIIEGDQFATTEEKKQGFLFFCAVETLKNPAELEDFFSDHRKAYDDERIAIVNPTNNKPLFEYSFDDNGNKKMVDGIKVYASVDSDGNTVYTTTNVEGSSLVFDEGKIPLIKQTGAGKMTDYLDYFYKPFLSRCPNSLVLIPGYYETTLELSTIMLSILIPVPVLLGLILTYYVPGLIFRRGRKSIGKLLFKIGIIDKTNLSPKFWRYTLRSLIIVLECALFVPAVISLTIMVFTRKGSTIHDLILKMNLVSTRGTKVYLDGVDALLGTAKVENRHIEFENISKLR